MAILGYLPGMVLCFGVGAWTYATQGIIILITPTTISLSWDYGFDVCRQYIFAIQKVTRVDPGDCFQGMT